MLDTGFEVSGSSCVGESGNILSDALWWYLMSLVKTNITKQFWRLLVEIFVEVPHTFPNTNFEGFSSASKARTASKVDSLHSVSSIARFFLGLVM